MGQQSTESQCVAVGNLGGQLTRIQRLRMRNLAKSKTYRDSVARWGKPTELIRKRVVIAPSLSLATTDGVSIISGKPTAKRTIPTPTLEVEEGSKTKVLLKI